MSKCIIVARIKSKPDSVEEVREELLKLVKTTRQKDDGCISYDLLQDNNDPGVFFFLEHWRSEDLLNNHLDSAHIKAYQKATEGMIEQREVNHLTRIS